jgi:cellulose synthase/poly-beta-1,6-N-acetylglucosamine synthase-like glycosyltransferase
MKHMADRSTIGAPNKRELLVIRVLVLLGLFSIANFLYWFLQTEFKSDSLLYWILVIILVYGILRILYMWYHYISISVPPAPSTKKTFSVDILTTFFPGEPYEMIEETLEAIQKITYPHTTYLCDEANDPYLKDFCAKLGVIHVSRNNRKDAKAGNINNALRQASGEICVILDPDHVPQPNFLDPIIPHFSNPEIGFVQIVQSYYNLKETLVARGAAEQTFQFYGPMMMSMNTYGTVNAIGANCTFRRAALDSIGGHAPGLSEDMHTAMLLHAKGWKSVYVPEVLAKGLAPSDLTSFYKQQLKWSRGTFDLLFYVYPKLFGKFTLRQKIHYGLLPLHYLIGTIYFLSFLVPILSLLMAKTPWEGNFLFFIVIALPLATSSFLIRAYIQKWVIEKSERGFHLVGGLLQITTWWIYFLGFVYTIFKKNIPYLPTPKNGEQSSNFRIIIPNIIMGVISLLAIFYGLAIDFTPFSIVMAFFALLNAFFMFFSVYLATRTTNRNQILRTSLDKNTVARLVKVKGWHGKLMDFLFNLIRPMAFPLLGTVILLCLFVQVKYLRSKWEGINVTEQKDLTISYLGIFLPAADNNGLSDLTAVNNMEKVQDLKFDLVSLYIPWGDRAGFELPKKKINDIRSKKQIPLITWEPWASTFKMADTIEALKNEKNILRYINSGHFDAYVGKVARYLKSLETPVFLRFAHEFDNPQYPWSPAGDNSPNDFVHAWKRVHEIFREEQAENVVWVWNPWKANNMKRYYPGDDYVDWIGVTGLNYGTFNASAQWHEFRELYLPYHRAIKDLTGKPVILAEFGSLKLGGNQQNWVKNAFRSIDSHFKEIEGLVFFNSRFDTNLPPAADIQNNRLDWSIDSLPFISAKYREPLPEFLFDKPIHLGETMAEARKTNTLPVKPFRGVKYKKGQNWLKNNFVPRREVILEDFRQMKALGLNTVQYSGPGIYDHNVLTYSKKERLSLVYSFWVPHTMDFVTDSIGKLELREKILTTIENYRAYDHIIAWHIGNDTWREMENTFSQPVLSYQRKAYMNWLRELTAAIKEVDRNKPLLLSMQLDKKAIDRIREMRVVAPHIDAYGMILGDSAPFTSFTKEAENNNIPFTISDMDVDTYFKLEEDLKEQSLVFRNWQDQWESDLVSFDGLLDFEGRKKEAFYELEGIWSEPVITWPTVDFKILKPSSLLYPGDTRTYHLVLLQNSEWVYPEEYLYDDRFEWYLVKTDEYGNKLGLKKLGTGVSKTIEIPRDHEFYEIMVSYFAHDMVSSRVATLNTPLEP